MGEEALMTMVGGCVLLKTNDEVDGYETWGDKGGVRYLYYIWGQSIPGRYVREGRWKV